MIHVAGPLFDGVQRCTRCEAILTDYRGAMVPMRCYWCGLVLRLPARHRPTCVLQSGEDVRPLLEL